jgi:hypothetical protein
MPRPLYPGEREADTHFIDGSVDPRAGLDDVESENSLCVPAMKPNLV